MDWLHRSIWEAKNASPQVPSQHQARDCGGEVGGGAELVREGDQEEEVQNAWRDVLENGTTRS